MTTPTRRSVSLGLSAWAGTAIGFATAQEQWPPKRVTIIVGFAAGGFADTFARAVARVLSDRWKSGVIVQNMPGAGGNIAARSVSIAPPDGFTLLATTTSLAINETLNKDKGFSVSALTPIAIPVEAPELLATNPKTGIKTLADAIELGKQGKLFMGSSGIGSGSHISAEYFFKVLAKGDVKHIPFPGGNPAMLALLTGDVNLMASTATVINSIVSGELTGLAAGGAARSPLLPNVPTYQESGYQGFMPSSWAGFFAPAQTPATILDTINAAVNDALNDSDVIRQLATLALVPRAVPRADAASYFDLEVRRWGEMVKALGLQG